MKVLLVDDFAVVGIVQRMLAELLLNLGRKLGHQLFPDGSVAEDIVRGHAGLAAVEKFSEDNAFGGQRNIGGFVHDAGAFAPQLQHHGGQMLRRPAQHLPAYALAAGEENEVKFLLQQSGVFRPAPRDHSHIRRVKAPGQNFGNEPSRGRSVGAGLYNGGISGGDGIGQRIHGQQEGIVPGAHDQGVAVGHRLGEAVGGKLRQRRGNGLCPGKAVGVADQEGQLRQHQPGFAQKALEGAFSQILLQSPGDGGLIGLNCRIEFFQLGHPEGHGDGGPGLIEGTLVFQQLLNFRIGHGAFLPSAVDGYWYKKNCTTYLPG